MVNYVEVTPSAPLPGGLLSVANVVDVATPRPALAYASEACGTAAVVPGDLCGMATVTLSQVGATLTVSISAAPAGTYTISEDGVGAPVVKTVRGPDPSTTFTVAAGASVIDISSTNGIDTTLNVTFPIAAPVSYVVGEKLFQPILIVQGSPFTVYKGVECSYVGEDHTSWAERALAVGEARAVEEGVMRQVLAVATTTDLTPGAGAVSIRMGLALLEGYAAQVYGGTPVLHVSRTLAALALTDDALKASETFRVHTAQGVPAANGGGYEINIGPTGAVAAAGEAWVYISGQVTLARDAVASYRALDWKQNDQTAIAERSYTPLVECFVAAVRVNLETP